MKERPILMNGDMVRAVLACKKTQTRRIIKPQPVDLGNDNWQFGDKFFCYTEELRDHLFHEVYGTKGTPYGALYADGGDRLWVRESFYIAEPYSWGRDASDEEIVPRGVQRGPVHFAADGLPANTPNKHYPNGLQGGAIAAPDPHAIWISRPSIHMPRWASRITLEITDVRVQRVQEISYEDCIAEGLSEPPSVQYGNRKQDMREDWRKLWQSIYGADSWQQNPWVWAITFKRIEK